MTTNSPVQAFRCPTCGAPLEPEQGALTMKCGYCGSSVVIPQSLRNPSPASASGVPQYNFGGMDLNALVGEAMRLPEVISMAESGRLDEAAQLYSQITGLSHEDALKSVQSMATGQAASFSPAGQGVSFQQVQTTYIQPDFATQAKPGFSGQSFNTNYKTVASPKRRSCFAVATTIVIFLFILVAGVAVTAYFVFGQSGSNLLGTFFFANKALSFGDQGTGQGMLNDARSIGVDSSGNIVTADYQDGRIQVFDSNGKFVSLFSLGQKVYVQAMSVNRGGKIFILHNQKIFVYDENGQQVSQIGDDNHDYSDVTVGADGTLYALSDNETIVRFKKDGTIDLEIPNSISNITGDTDIDTHLAVDGLGNMYILGSFTNAVFKYSPQGKFVNQFGGGKTGNSDDPAKLDSPLAISVDGYGRIFVADIFTVKVYDSSGSYINGISEDNGAVFGLAFDGQNNLYTVSTGKVVKFSVQKPQGN